VIRVVGCTNRGLAVLDANIRRFSRNTLIRPRHWRLGLAVASLDGLSRRFDPGTSSRTSGSQLLNRKHMALRARREWANRLRRARSFTIAPSRSTGSPCRTSIRRERTYCAEILILAFLQELRTGCVCVRQAQFGRQGADRDFRPLGIVFRTPCGDIYGC
jgi:hypothetical protein